MKFDNLFQEISVLWWIWREMGLFHSISFIVLLQEEVVISTEALARYTHQFHSSTSRGYDY